MRSQADILMLDSVRRARIILGRSPSRGRANRDVRKIAVSDRGTLGGLTQFLTQFGVSG
jgi:hypothetical protein